MEGALTGVAERLITGEVVGLARRVAPPRPHTLDAVHLVIASVLDVDEVVADDDRLLEACRSNGPATAVPGC